MHQENCQLKSTLLDYSTDRIVYVGCIFRFFVAPKAEDCTPQLCNIRPEDTYRRKTKLSLKTTG